MKKLSIFALLSAAALFALFTSSTPVAYASSFEMTFNNAGPWTAGSDYVYPYYFTINTGTTTYTNVPLMCIDYNLEIVDGESWKANLYTAGSLGTQYEEAAYLYSLAANDAAHGINPEDAQWAAWYLFDPAAGATDPGDGTNISSLIALAAVNASGYANYDVYLPVSGTQSWGGTPQTFIGFGETPNIVPTPEPSSLLLLGSGLFALGFFVLRNSKSAGLLTNLQ